MIFRPALVLALIASTITLAQDSRSWSEIHKQDEAKWAAQTGLSPFTVHQLWRLASRFADTTDDDSRIQRLDVASLGRNHVVLVTYAGSEYCLTFTVFAQTRGYQKIWSEDTTPEGDGFCGTDPQVWITEGKIVVSMESNPPQTDNGRVEITNYSYEWNGKTYHFAGKWRTYRNSSDRSR